MHDQYGSSYYWFFAFKSPESYPWCSCHCYGWSKWMLLLIAGLLLPSPTTVRLMSPWTILTQKFQNDMMAICDLDKRLCKDQWKKDQYLANEFWLRWRHEYLQFLQKRPKWNYDRNSLKVGDIVLLKAEEVIRNCWPVGQVTQTFPSEDGRSACC